MGYWKEKKLGDLLTQRKEQVVIQPELEYSLVTITNKGEVKLREKKRGGLIRAKKGYVTKAGDFIYSRLSVHTGAFGIVPEELNNALITNEMPSFQIDREQIHPKILLDLIWMHEFQWKLKQLTKGMGRVRIKESMMLDLQLIFPVTSKQQHFVDKIDAVKRNRHGVVTELTHQQTLLKKFRQQILQEAIEGKLTADWRQHNPDVEPASELLARIQAEKAKLIKDRKIKKQKPLLPISEKEKPFVLPEGWMWCRMREFAIQNVDCPHDTPTYQDTGFYCLRASDVTENGLLVGTIRRVSREEYEKRIRRFTPKKNDLVYIREGGRLGIAGLIDIDTPVCLGQRVMLLRFLNQVFSQYAVCFLNAPKTYRDITEKTLGSTSPHVNVRDVIAHATPVPPLEEQKAIVTKVEKLFTLCDQLETQITTNQTHAEQLMQAVLREAFSHSFDKQNQEAANA